MQFIWKYIDELVGKGLEWYVVAKLLFFASAHLVPMALPLSILLSSIMTFGNMAEHNELAACKAAGIPLQKIMRPLVLVAICTSGFAFVFSNYILPKANLKMGSLLYDIRQQRPAFSIKEGIFYNGIAGYSIKVQKKDDDGVSVHGVMIYDHRSGLGNTKVIVAQQGKMLMTEDKNYLEISLENGSSYEENSKRNPFGIDTHPLLRSTFKKQIIRFDLSGLKLSRTNEELFKSSFQMMNVNQLQYAEDSLKKQEKEAINDFRFGLSTYTHFLQSKVVASPVPDTLQVNNYAEQFTQIEKVPIVENALVQARNVKSFIDSNAEAENSRLSTIRSCMAEWHLKFTLSIACIVLFFIGAPLGAIIRKGGLGMPVIFSTIFFIIFHILSITGLKMAREGAIPVVSGLWLASATLMPIGIFLTYKATTDSALFESEFYGKIYQSIGKLLKRKK